MNIIGLMPVHQLKLRNPHPANHYTTLLHVLNQPVNTMVHGLEADLMVVPAMSC